MLAKVENLLYDVQDLNNIIDDLTDGEVLELVGVDGSGTLLFEINTYGLYY
jgi:hypothetical protein